MAVAIADIPAEPKRDRWGRYVIDGTGYTRATTIAGTLEDTYNLGRWQMRMAVHGATLRDDLLATAQAHNPEDDKQTYDKLVTDALAAANSKRKANIGTALHRFTQDLDLGVKTLADIPEEHRGTCANYLEIMDLHGVEIDSTRVEQVVIDTGRKVAGTCDRIATLADGRRVIADLKTGTDLSWGWMKILIQMAIYAHHTHTYDYATEKKGKRIDVDLTEALVIHVPADGKGATLHLVDLEAGFDLYMLALETREWRKSAKKHVKVYNPAVTPYKGAAAQRDWLADRVRAIAAAGHLEHLALVWPADVPQPLPADITSSQADALALVLDQVEAAHQMPFAPTGRPGTTPATKTPKKKAA